MASKYEILPVNVRALIKSIKNIEKINMKDYIFKHKLETFKMMPSRKKYSELFD